MPPPLDTLLAELKACRICRDEPRYGNRLPHDPRPVIQAAATARILIAGQAPGVRVHASGKPFTDPSGVRLRQWMALDETEFYNEKHIAIVPMGHCFPGLDSKGSGLAPRRECAPLWRKPIFEALPNLKLILVIGQYARDWHLPDYKGRSLTETVMAWREISARDTPYQIIPLPHPSWRNSGWLKKNNWFEADLLPVLRAEIRSYYSLSG
jgi:uracil-DNA glycosylase